MSFYVINPSNLKISLNYTKIRHACYISVFRIVGDSQPVLNTLIVSNDGIYSILMK